MPWVETQVCTYEVRLRGLGDEESAKAGYLRDAEVLVGTDWYFNAGRRRAVVDVHDPVSVPGVRGRRSALEGERLSFVYKGGLYTVPL